MNINNKKFLATILPIVVFLPLLASAAGWIQCEGASDCNFDTFAKTINYVINWFISISVSVAAITFSYAGAKILLNPDNSSKRTEALEMFKKTAMGMLFILGAWLIVHTIVTTFVTNAPSALRYLKG